MSGIYDISSAVTLQRQLIYDISGMAFVGNAEAQRAISSIASNLDAVANSFGNANNAIVPALTYQDQVLTILDREKNRLTDRKVAVEAAYNGQRRMITLNDSAVAKQKSYNYILMVVALTLVLYVGIRVLRSYQLVPDALLDIIAIIVVSLGIIYCLVLFTDISHRSKMDFNQITLANPLEKSQAEKDSAGITSGAQLLTPAAGNVCAAGTEFNNKYQVCIPTTVPYGTKLKDSQGNDITLTDSNYTNYKIFADLQTSPVSFYWDNTTDKCTAGNTYSATDLACVPSSQGFTTMTAALAVPYTPSEFSSYSKY